MPDVVWTDGAVGDLEKLDRQIAQRILKKVTWFGENFQNIVPEALSGSFSSAYKLRVGDWRVIYTLEDEAIIIQAIGHRREIYG